MKRILTAAALAASMLSVVLLPSLDASARPTAVSWSGRWNRLASEIDPGGPTAFTLHQAGSHLTGSLAWKGCTTKKGGSIVGLAEGRVAVIAVRQLDGTLVSATLKLSANGAHISGSYQVAAGTCSATGPFTATRVS